MKKLACVLLLAALACALMTGCDENSTKTGGGGRQQSYDLSTGKYN